VGPNADLDALKKKFLPLAEINRRFLGRPDHSLVTTPDELSRQHVWRTQTMHMKFSHNAKTSVKQYATEEHFKAARFFVRIR
jgi:hypothetical protein